MIGGATSLAGPVVAAIVFSLLAETLRLQLPYAYMMVLGLLLILCVLFLPNGIATLWQKKGASHG
jgi:branched-chain amino acid transport system permease protein